MIIVAFFLFFSLLIIEFWVYKTRKINNGLIADIKQNDFNLEILKALSFLPHSKNLEIEDDLRGVFTSFVNQYLQNNLQNPWSNMIVILENPNPGVYRFSTKNPVNEIEAEKSNELNNLEKGLINALKPEDKSTHNPINIITKENPLLEGLANINTVVIGRLKYRDNNLGYLFFLSPDGRINVASNDFYISVFNIVTLLVLKFYSNQTLSKEEQLRAVSAKW